MIRKALLVLAVVVCFGAIMSDAVGADLQSVLSKSVRCGKANGGKTCDDLGLKGQCCSGVGYCGTTSYHCNADKGCQSGPCKKTETSDGDKPQEVSSDESDETKVIVKVISNPVPLCKNCKEEEEGGESGGESGSDSADAESEETEETQEQEKQEAAKTEAAVSEATEEAKVAEAAQEAEAEASEDEATEEDSEDAEEESEDAAEAAAEENGNMEAEASLDESETGSVDENAEKEEAKAEADKDDAAAAAPGAAAAAAGGSGCGKGCVDASTGVAAIKRITAEGEKKAKQIIAAATKAAAEHKANGGKKMVVVDVPGQNSVKAGGDLIVPVSQRKLENVMDPNGY